MIKKIVEDTGVSVKVLISISGLLLLFASTWAQISVKMSELSSEIKYMNFQLTTLIDREDTKLQNEIDQLKQDQWTRRDMSSLQMESEKALNEAGLKVTLPRTGE